MADCSETVVGRGQNCLNNAFFKFDQRCLSIVAPKFVPRSVKKEEKWKCCARRDGISIAEQFLSLFWLIFVHKVKNFYQIQSLQPLCGVRMHLTGDNRSSSGEPASVGYNPTRVHLCD